MWAHSAKTHVRLSRSVSAHHIRLFPALLLCPNSQRIGKKENSDSMENGRNKIRLGVVVRVVEWIEALDATIAGIYRRAAEVRQ